MTPPTKDDVFDWLVIVAIVIVVVAMMGKWFLQGYRPDKHLTKPPTAFGIWANKAERIFNTLFAWAFVVAVVFGGYIVAQEEGWISHSERATVAGPAHTWQSGEYLSCVAQSFNGSATAPGGIVLDCTGGMLSAAPSREMDVKFYGEVRKNAWWNFKCERLAESVVCHQQN